MEAQLSPAGDSTRSGLTVNDAQSVRLSFEGDYAAGMRTLAPDAGVRGDFATGMRRNSPLLGAGGFATGMARGWAGPGPRGDFATGQRSEAAATATRSR
jgi:hypothetical protein